MTVLSRYLARRASPTATDQEPVFDEFAAADGTVRQGWSSLLDGLDEFADTDLVQAQREVARLLEDDNVTYTPSPASAISIADEPNGMARRLWRRRPACEPQPWRLDPLPLILDDREWAGSRLVWCSGPSCWMRSWPIFTAPAGCWSAAYPSGSDFRPRRVSAATRRQRGSGRPAIVHDRSRFGARHQRAVEGDLRSDSGALRCRIRHAEPPCGIAGDAGDLSPGQPAPAHALLPGDAPRPRRCGARRSGGSAGRRAEPGHTFETAFDQAFVASLLGFPLLEGSDLTVRDGRVWMRVLGKLEEVDVILRRVDSTWMDALELRPDSRLGSPD